MVGSVQYDVRLQLSEALTFAGFDRTTLYGIGKT